MTDLSLERFSPSADSAYASVWHVDVRRTVATGSGGDLITGVVSGDPSMNSYNTGSELNNAGFIGTGSGDDRLSFLDQMSSWYGGQIFWASSVLRPRLHNSGVIHTGTGDDQMFAENSHSGGQPTSLGILNEGLIETGTGDDWIRSDGYVGLTNHGTLDAGIGDDFIAANGLTNVDPLLGTDEFLGDAGVHNAGLIRLGQGDDSLLCSGRTIGLRNEGLIRFGSGADRLAVDASPAGLQNKGSILMGLGADSILVNALKSVAIDNTGILATGPGHDTIEFSCFGGGPSLINRANGQIRMGSGDDVFRNSSPPPYDSIFSPQGSRPVLNDGLIDLGDGNDLVDCLVDQSASSSPVQPGFLGFGRLTLGRGNDTLRGFGDGTFLGGAGLDTLVLPPGTYRLQSLSADQCLIAGRMLVSGFEAFGTGADRSSFEAALAFGSVTFN